MVSNVTSLSGNGFRDWIIQRLTAVVIGAFFLCLIGFFIVNQPLTFMRWQAFFAHEWMRVFSFMFLLALAYHAWIGIWAVTNDYLKCVCVRFTVQCVVVLALVAYFAWGVRVLWGL